MSRTDRPLWYVAHRLDRAGHRRRDDAGIEALLRGAESRVLPVWRTRNLVVRGPEGYELAYLAGREAAWFADQGGTVAFLGMLDDIAHFMIDLSHLETPDNDPVLAERGRFMDLRRVGPTVEAESGALMAYARGLATWHGRHLYCGVCGAPTEARDGGHLRVCADPACGAEHFPRTDPAVIMLVTHGNTCLLGRQASWPEGRYSVLAGFVEPGESLERAVAREVYEETRIRTRNVRYHASQPWPFPSSIMLGFYAEAETTEIRVDGDELEDAQWFSRDRVARGEVEGFLMPRGDSIAYRLIEDWLAGAG
ncbi:MAG: NAD(+) diphosphatase [Alphaproteobacteria bacterium]|nr:NAD(+) diphosphatase [Alphaproteobacteria bacterium]